MPVSSASRLGIVFHYTVLALASIVVLGPILWALSTSLKAPGEVLAHNHKGTASGRLVKAAYEAAGAGDRLTRSEAKLDAPKVVEWLAGGPPRKNEP